MNGKCEGVREHASLHKQLRGRGESARKEDGRGAKRRVHLSLSDNTVSRPRWQVEFVKGWWLREAECGTGVAEGGRVRHRCG
eukprot:357674-Chlamydomonas_euryale.AAC.3